MTFSRGIILCFRLMSDDWVRYPPIVTLPSLYKVRALPLLDEFVPLPTSNNTVFEPVLSGELYFQITRE